MNLKKNNAAAAAAAARCRSQVSMRVVISLFICVIGITVGYQFFMNNSHSDYMVKVFEVDANKFGYKIMRDERTVIMQPFVPGISGKRFFASPGDAQRVGELVRERLETGQEFSITPKDLQQLEILSFAD